MQPEILRKKTPYPRLSFAVSTLFLLACLELTPNQRERRPPDFVIIVKNDQTIVLVGDYRGSASVVLSKSEDKNLLNVHLADANAFGGMLNAEFSGPLPQEGETMTYELNEANYVWFVEKDISDRRSHGILALRKENGNLYGEVLDTGEPLTFFLKY